MKTEYNGIEIAYIEGSDDWHFELRGRSRTTTSLSKAKEAIDKEPAEKRTQAFPRFEAYLHHYNRGFIKVTVTSLADDRYHSGISFWVQTPDGRKKERYNGLYPVNDHNTAIVNQWQAKKKEIEKHEKELSVIHEKLKHATVPAEIAA